MTRMNGTIGIAACPFANPSGFHGPGFDLIEESDAMRSAGQFRPRAANLGPRGSPMFKITR